MNCQQTLRVTLCHRSSIPSTRWCRPVDWEPRNVVPGAEFVDGAWWSECENEAGLVCFRAGEEGDEIDVLIDDLRVASCGECRVVGSVTV